MTDYDAAKDAHDSYFVAIEEMRRRKVIMDNIKDRLENSSALEDSDELACRCYDALSEIKELETKIERQRNEIITLEMVIEGDNKQLASLAERECPDCEQDRHTAQQLGPDYMGLSVNCTSCNGTGKLEPTHVIVSREEINRIIQAAEFHAQSGVSGDAARYAHQSTANLAKAMISAAKGEEDG